MSAEHDDLVLFIVVDVSGVLGDVGAVGPSRIIHSSSADVGRGGVGAGPTTAAPASFRASARVSQHADLVLSVVVDVAGVFGDAGAICSSRGT